MRLARAQAGVVTTEQALGCGLSRHALARMAGQGQWQRMARGVFFAASGEIGWDARAWAGVLLGGEGARLGAQSSAFLHRLRPEPPDLVDVLVRGERIVRVTGAWVFHRDGVGVRSPRTVGSPPRLRIEDVVLDLSDQGDGADTIRLVTKAVQQRLTTADRLVAALGHRRRHRHRALLTALLCDVADGAESALELAYLRDVERPHGLPRGNRQRSRLGLPYCSDVGYDEHDLLVELDGRDGHRDVGRFRDMQRDNRFAVRAWLTLRYGWFDVVHHPCSVAAQVATALRDRGWAGDFARCRRCLRVPEAAGVFDPDGLPSTV